MHLMNRLMSWLDSVVKWLAILRLKVLKLNNQNSHQNSFIDCKMIIWLINYSLLSQWCLLQGSGHSKVHFCSRCKWSKYWTVDYNQSNGHPNHWRPPIPQCCHLYLFSVWFWSLSRGKHMYYKVLNIEYHHRSTLNNTLQSQSVRQESAQTTM